MIELKNISKTFETSDGNVHALKDVNLTINDGEIYGIIGMSGAGKSTLVRCINMLERPTSGEVIINGENIGKLSDKQLRSKRRKMTMIFQGFNLLMQRNCLDNICFPLELSGMKKKDARVKAAELLETVGLPDKGYSYPAQLSGGQQQRIAIARALTTNPEILLCDEATSALDPQTTHSILELIRDIQKKMNLTVVMITHQMEVVRDACDYVSVLNEGSIVETGRVSEIFSNPKSEVTKDFLSHMSSNFKDLQKEHIVRWSNFGGKYVLRFIGDKTGEPVISSACKKFNVEFNIRAGGIQNLSDKEKIGIMLVDLSGEKAEVEKTIDYLKSAGVNVELAGEGL
ncbi:MAG: ATP-binding cassette domain-containing protein [Clostridia bacterium]|nr:ATP-binding cassette domain-containing protein [Clostridia bacterium]